ncbi:MAG: hypothetical protein U0232_25485 [Thermomicrobiales bacterium]
MGHHSISSSRRAAPDAGGAAPGSTTCLAAVPPLGAPLRRDDASALDWIGAGYVFTGAIRRAIHRFKYGRERARASTSGR